jgi:pimeloyl-ACP methyl ester carboxylesterase
MSMVPGLVKHVVSQVAFFPPKPAGYHITDSKQVYLVGPECGLAPIPDLTSEGVAVDTVKMWTQRGNTIMGFHFRRADANRTILFSHGNSTDIGIMFQHLREMCSVLKVNVFAYEYSGYGESTGVASEADLYADIDAAYHYLTDDCSLLESSIILFGQSVGSVPSIDLAARSDIGGMVLHSALKSGLSVIHEVSVTYWFDVFQNATKIENVRAPVFCIHGTHDTEVPFEHGAALFEATPTEFAYEPWWVKEAGHNDIEINHRAEYWAKLQGFLRSVSQNARW